MPIDQNKIWNTMYWLGMVWLICIAGLLAYDIYLMWFQNTKISFLRPNNGLKVTLLIVPALTIYMVAVSKRKAYSGGKNA